MKVDKYGLSDYDEWFDEYKPVKNLLDKNASMDGRAFETYGVEDTYIGDYASKHPFNVWTMLDVDGCLVTINGWHYVDRYSYFITKKPWVEGDNFNIYFDEDLPKVRRRLSKPLKKQK